MREMEHEGTPAQRGGVMACRGLSKAVEESPCNAGAGGRDGRGCHQHQQGKRRQQGPRHPPGHRRGAAEQGAAGRDAGSCCRARRGEVM